MARGYQVILVLVISIIESSHPYKISPEPACITKKDPAKTYKFEKPSCAVPVSELPKARLSEATAPRDKGLFPPWLNETLMKHAQKFALQRSYQIGLSHLFGLTLILMFPDAMDALLMTRKTDTPEGVMKRYIATQAQTDIWYHDLYPWKNDSAIHLSIRGVRSRHLAAAEQARDLLAQDKPLVDESVYANTTIDQPLWDAYLLDVKNLNVSTKFPSYYYELSGGRKPVSQLMQGMTLYAFCGFPVLYPERLSIKATDEDVWAYNHFWAVLGYAFGLEDQFNIALQPDLKTLRENYKKIFDDYFLPVFHSPMNFKTKIIIGALLKGYDQLYPNLSPASQLYRLVKHIGNIPAPNLRKRFTPEEEKYEQMYEGQFFPLLMKSKEHQAKANSAMEKFTDLQGKKLYPTYWHSPKEIAKYVYAD